jgi:hypothetical protein
VDLNFGVFLDRLPTGGFWQQLLHLVGKQRRDAASARYASLFGKVCIHLECLIALETYSLETRCEFQTSIG